MSDGHDVVGNVMPPWQMPALAGAGALRSNAEDMLRFLAANMGPPASSLARSMRVTHEIQKQIDSRGGIGLGLEGRTRRRRDHGFSHRRHRRFSELHWI